MAFSYIYLHVYTNVFSFAATVTEGERLITSPSPTNKDHSFPTEVKQFSFFYYEGFKQDW